MTLKNRTPFGIPRAAPQAACPGHPPSPAPVPSTRGGAAAAPGAQPSIPSAGSRHSHRRPGLPLSTRDDAVFRGPAAKGQRLHPPHAASALPPPSESEGLIQTAPDKMVPVPVPLNGGFPIRNEPLGDRPAPTGTRREPGPPRRGAQELAGGSPAPPAARPAGPARPEAALSRLPTARLALAARRRERGAGREGPAAPARRKGAKRDRAGGSPACRAPPARPLIGRLLGRGSPAGRP